MAARFSQMETGMLHGPWAMRYLGELLPTGSFAAVSKSSSCLLCYSPLGWRHQPLYSVLTCISPLPVGSSYPFWCLNCLGGCFLSCFRFLANQSEGAASCSRRVVQDSKLSSWLSCFWKMCDHAVNRTISCAFPPRLYLVYSCERYLGNSCSWPWF